MNLDNQIFELQQRLTTVEPDETLRPAIRELLVTRLSDEMHPLTYCAKDSFSRAITALIGNAARPGTDGRHPKLHFALLQLQLGLIDEDDRDDGHAHPDEIIESLTREMLLSAARSVPELTAN